MIRITLNPVVWSGIQRGLIKLPVESDHGRRSEACIRWLATHPELDYEDWTRHRVKIGMRKLRGR